MKFIASSSMLLKFLQNIEKENGGPFQYDHRIALTVTDHNLSLSTNPEMRLGVEHRQDGDAVVDGKNINSLVRVLKTIQDQPVVIFHVSGDLSIQNIIL